MKPLEYEGNTQYMRYEYHRVREGPNYFVTYYKNSSRLIYDPKDAWRTLGVAKFTDSGKALKEWCLSMDDQYGPGKAEGVARSGRPDTSFASEAMDELNDNTKMVL
tara:strand:+ start:121 stop:438 length:318 start_codon:yes stop_codon:yes gene_type:complete